MLGGDGGVVGEPAFERVAAEPCAADRREERLGGFSVSFGEPGAGGNGGSAANAMDAVADLRLPPARWPPRAAIDLTEDPAIITAIANDAGEGSIFSAQIITHGREDDTLLAFSTSGGSRNVLAALAEARQRGLLTVAFVGYDGGRVAAEGLAEHVVITRSDVGPRLHEAQASAWHVLRELVETHL